MQSKYFQKPKNFLQRPHSRVALHEKNNERSVVN